VTRQIALSPTERAIVQAILRTHLPPATQAFVFGSRATATSRHYSDLDLALEWGKPLSPEVLASISEALSESDLPYKVDILDLRSIDATFRTIIEPEMIALAY
jgi:predicted nucleotidyltransferase